MLNHFRTLLINETPADVGEAVEFGVYDEYTSIELPTKIQAVYDILLPPGLSTSAKVYLVNNYCQCINAAKLDEVFELVDGRVTYDLGGMPDFNIARNTKALITGIASEDIPAVSAFDIVGVHEPGTLNFDPKIIAIEQTNDKVSGYVVNSLGTHLSTIAENLDLDMTYIDATKSMSELLPLPGTGLSFRITWSTLPDIIAENKKWTFTTYGVFGPQYVYNVYNSLLEHPNLIADLFKLKSSVSVKSFDRLWMSQLPATYRLAGLLTGLVYRMDYARG